MALAIMYLGAESSIACTSGSTDFLEGCVRRVFTRIGGGCMARRRLAVVPFFLPNAASSLSSISVSCSWVGCVITGVYARVGGRVKGIVFLYRTGGLCGLIGVFLSSFMKSLIAIGGPS